jgi:ATP-dependent helicase/nuclease subunit A
VTANAGTGKTRVLSDRVLRLLLTGADPESILAITFTKAAAAEMTARVNERLAAWASAPQERLEAELQALGDAAPRPAEIERARRLFGRVLELPRGLAIQTIHGLCGAILRRFPLEAGVAPHFETLDERTANELLIEAREQVLARARRGDDALRVAIEKLTRTLTEGSLNDALAELLRARIRLARLVEQHGGLKGLMRAVERALDIARPDVEPEELVRVACRIGDEARAQIRRAADILAASSTRDQACADRLYAWLRADDEARHAAFPTYCRAFLTAAGTPVKEVCTKSIGKSHPDVLDALIREQTRIVQVDEEIRGVLTARRTGWLLTIGWAVIEAYERLKGQRAALDFDDLIERTRRLLDTPDGLGWVLYKLDQRIDHVLVDEAQDTSPAQWELIERLTDEFFAGQGAREGAPSTLFVVGDEKQSIYRFQGADLENFRSVRGRLETRGQASARPFLRETLDLSFRSSRPVLELVDAVFSLPEARDGVVDEDAAVRHASSRQHEAGRVELWPMAVCQESPPASDGQWVLPGELQPDDEPHRRLANAIAARVRCWIDEGEVLPATGRPIRPGDILVLLQRRGEMQDLLVRAFKREGVEVAGADRLALTDHIAVQDLVALGRAMLLPEDDLNLACLLKSPLVGLDEEALLELAWNRGGRSLMERLRGMAEQHAERFGPAMQRIAGWLRRADFQPPYEFYTQVLGAERGRERLLARLGREALEPVEAFLGQALAYEQGHPASLEGFLHWLGLDEQELKRDPETASDSLRVMTVHGAKGLEAPVVILADAGPHDDPTPGRLLWDDAGLPLWRSPQAERPNLAERICQREKLLEAQERRRLLYVALTRAKDRIHITGCLGKQAARSESKGSRDPSAWHDLVRQALQDRAEVETLAVDLGHGIAGVALRLTGGVSGAAPDGQALPARSRAALPDWAQMPVMPETAAARPRAPSRLGEPEPPASSPSGPGGEARFRFGLHVHKLLQLLPNLPAQARPRALDRYLARTTDLDKDLREHARTRVSMVLDHPELRDAFGPGSRAEQAICGMVHGVPIAGQIDRLAVTADRVLLLDYKTNRRPPATAADTPLVYLRQMAAYRELLCQIYPGRRVAAALVWTETATVTWLEPGLLDPHIPGRTPAVAGTQRALTIEEPAS